MSRYDLMFSELDEWPRAKPRADLTAQGLIAYKLNAAGYEQQHHREGDYDEPAND